MKTIFIIGLVLNSLFISAQSKVGSSEFGKEMVEIIQHMKSYTLAIANQMPEEKYNFKPADVDTVRTFGEQLKHIAAAVKFQTETILEGKTFEPPKVIKELAAYEESVLSKAEIISALTTSFDMLIAKLSLMTDDQFNAKYKFPLSRTEPKSLRVFTMFIRDHITHHRAQAIVSLRMNGIEPEFYRPF